MNTFGEDEHILLQKARTYQRPTGTQEPADSYYDLAVGAWRSNANGELVVNGNMDRKPSTKKADMETGEDQKGE